MRKQLLALTFIMFGCISVVQAQGVTWTKYQIFSSEDQFDLTDATQTWGINAGGTEAIDVVRMIDGVPITFFGKSMNQNGQVVTTTDYSGYLDSPADAYSYANTLKFGAMSTEMKAVFNMCELSDQNGEYKIKQLVTGARYRIHLIAPGKIPSGFDGRKFFMDEETQYLTCFGSYGSNFGVGMVTGEFTATSDTQVFSMRGEAGDPGCGFSAIVVSQVGDVPEPAMLALLGAGAVALIRRRRCNSA